MRREDNPTQPKRDVTNPRSNPASPWVCGHIELGQGCSSGPTCDGRCGRISSQSATAETASAEAGAARPELATASLCIPRRSLPVRRQSMRLNLAILTGGFLMLCLLLPSREKTFVPGELSARHAQILDNTLASERCSLCHPSSHGPDDAGTGHSPLHGVLASAKRLIENDGRQDQLCLKCHQAHMARAVNRDPHDLSADMWRELQRDLDVPWQLVSTRSSEAANSGDASIQQKTSCASCHNEHHGRGFDIKLISDTRCQACHQKQFESLASGHPEFKNFPVDRPRSLAFSHGKHAQDHFPKKNRDFDCRACHLTNAPGHSQDLIARSVTFERACASCHEQPIRAATVDGWATLQLPSIEAADATTDPKFSSWPTEARFGYDGVVSPVMRALLMADPLAEAALAKLPASGKIVDISTISSARAAVAKALALATTRLIDDTAREGQAAWITRLEQVTQRHLQRKLNEPDRKLIAAMVAGLPPDLFRQVQAQWLGGTESLAQQPQPKGRLVATSSSASSISAASNSTTRQDPPSNDDLLIEKSNDNQSTASSDDQLLSKDLLNDADAENAKTDGLTDALLEPSSVDGETSSGKPSHLPSKKLVKGVTHLASGGWYADPITLSVRYMPTGHADPTLAAWTLWWSMLEAHQSAAAESLEARVSRSMSLASTAKERETQQSLVEFIPGKCTECHQLKSSVSQLVSTENVRPINSYFQIIQRDAAAREFTKFRHTPHLTLPALADCRYCHQEKGTLTTIGVSRATHPLTSEFASMKLQQCSACHRPGGANDRCVQCHNYHIQPSAEGR